jgi:hypothetical protein
MVFRSLQRSQQVLTSCSSKPRRFKDVGGQWFFAIVFLLGAVLPSVSNAEIFSCKDEAGRVITSDRPIPECSKRDIRVLRQDGLTKGVIAAPLTEEQRKQRDVELEIKRQKDNQERERLSRDRALVAAYPDLASLEVQRKRQIQDVQVEIEAAKKRILIKEPDLKEAKAELEFYRGKKVPGVVANKISVAANAILVEDELIRAKQQEILTVNSKFDADAKRLREISDGVTGRLAQSSKH